jgi:hypothetical protein
MADLARSAEALAPPFEESEWRPAEAREDTATPAPSRDAWRLRRLDMEARQVKHTPTGARKRRHWPAFKALMKLFGKGLKLAGVYRRGVANALAIQETEFALEFAELPAAFDGFQILQMSDLHVDALPGAFQAALDLAAARPADLCVLTGDYKFCRPSRRWRTGWRRATASSPYWATTAVRAWSSPWRRSAYKF